MTTTRIPRLLDNGFMYNEAKFELELADCESGLFLCDRKQLSLAVNLQVRSRCKGLL